MNALDLKIQAAFIAENIKTNDIPAYVLSNPDKLGPGLLKEVANHLEFTSKLPEISEEWFKNKEKLVAPQKLSLEQASSSFTAQYKASLFNGKIGVDLTGGLGVDSFYLSKSFNKFFYIEKNSVLFEIVQHNFRSLNLNNIECINTSAYTYVENCNEILDIVYLDPARRDSNNKKLVSISDCEPNLLMLQSQLFKVTNNILVKYSPMLDIKLAIKEIENIHKIFVIAIRNEVKELLFLICPSGNVTPNIICINQNSDQTVSEFEFDYINEENALPIFSEPLKYLYEPNATILKAGAFKSISSRFNIFKLASNSHLYTSNEIVDGFPGRAFVINNITKYKKKEVLSLLHNNKANVACRNFPLKPDDIKKQLNIKDGGEVYLFFTENIKKEKIVLFCEKIK